ncbi:hypothetical protein FACS1894103_5780 [Campylobacterota bacterium]|nr:hypothetical protein FACS1894103_5780 [Campylobacterota bacterium]
MLNAYDLDLLGSEARGLDLFIAARVPKAEWATNEDMARLTFLSNELLKSKFAPYLDFNAISNEINQIQKKYQNVPDRLFEKMKAQAAQMQATEQLVA